MGNNFLAHCTSNISADGSTLVYSTYLGGSGIDQCFGIAMDSSSNAYVTGFTTSPNFPTMNPLQPYGWWDAFVSKLNPTGAALVYSACLGGSSYDIGYGIAVDSAGNAYVTGGGIWPSRPGEFHPEPRSSL